MITLNADGTIPSEDGYITVRALRHTVKYHVSRCFLGDPKCMTPRQVVEKALVIACICTEVLRNRMSSKKLYQHITYQCTSRLELMRELLSHAENNSANILQRHTYLPIVPQWINCMIVNPYLIEAVVYLAIGKKELCSSLVLRFIGSRWICTVADIG